MDWIKWYQSELSLLKVYFNLKHFEDVHAHTCVRSWDDVYRRFLVWLMSLLGLHCPDVESFLSCRVKMDKYPLVQNGSVQFKMVSMRTEMRICAPVRLSELFSQCRLWNGSNVRQTDDGPLSTSQRRSSSASSLNASLLREIEGVMSLALCPLEWSASCQRLPCQKALSIFTERSRSWQIDI